MYLPLPAYRGSGGTMYQDFPGGGAGALSIVNWRGEYAMFVPTVYILLLYIIKNLLSRLGKYHDFFIPGHPYFTSTQEQTYTEEVGNTLTLICPVNNLGKTKVILVLQYTVSARLIAARIIWKPEVDNRKSEAKSTGGHMAYWSESVLKVLPFKQL